MWVTVSKMAVHCAKIVFLPNKVALIGRKRIRVEYSRRSRHFLKSVLPRSKNKTHLCSRVSALAKNVRNRNLA